jgi:hypothetical protein
MMKLQKRSYTFKHRWRKHGNIFITWISSFAASQDGIQVQLLLHNFASEFPVSVSSAAEAPVHTNAAASL